MRETNEIIEIVDSVKKSTLATQEEIVYYIVDKKEQGLDVMVELRNDQSELLKTERYTFERLNNLNNLTENFIWDLIDDRRSETPAAQ